MLDNDPDRVVALSSAAPGAASGRGGSFVRRHSDEALRPLVVVEGVSVDEKAVWLVAEPGQISGTKEAILGLLFGGVDAKDLQVVPILLVPGEFTVLATMFSRPAVEERRMPNVPEQVNVHQLTV